MSRVVPIREEPRLSSPLRQRESKLLSGSMQMRPRTSDGQSRPLSPPLHAFHRPGSPLDRSSSPRGRERRRSITSSGHRAPIRASPSEESATRSLASSLREAPAQDEDEDEIAAVFETVNYFEYEDDEDEDLKDLNAQKSPLDPEDEALLEELFFKKVLPTMTTRSSELLDFVHIRHVELKPGHDLGIALDGVPVMSSNVSALPLSTNVTAVEKLGLVHQWRPSEDEAVIPDETTIIRLVKVTQHSGESETGLRGILLLRELLKQQGQGSSCTLDLVFAREARFRFIHKQREVSGTALHVAALHRDGADVLRKLLEQKAAADQEAHYMSSGNRASLQAIHLAATQGFTGHLKILLQFGANANAMTRIEGKGPNNTALHEVGLYPNLETAHFLISSKADVNAKNLKDHTPLHIAAKWGHVSLSKCLVNYGSDIQALDNRGKRPVAIAVHEGHFPFNKLFILMKISLTDLIIVAELCSSVAQEIMRDAGTGRIDASWKEELQKEAEVNPAMATRQLIQLAYINSGAAEDIFDIFTYAAQAQDDAYNPIPKQCKIPEGEFMLSAYVPTAVWDWNVDEQAKPPWQRKLCPGVVGAKWGKKNTRTRSGMSVRLRRIFCCCKRDRGDESLRLSGTLSEKALKRIDHKIDHSDHRRLTASGTAAAVGAALDPSSQEGTDMVPIKIRTLKLPGIMNPDILSILVFTSDNNSLLLKPSGQGIINYCWTHVARYHYFCYVFYQVLIIGILAYEVLEGHYHTDDSVDLSRRVTWSAICVFAHMELIYEIWEFLGMVCYLRLGMDYTMKVENWYNWICIGTLTAMVYISTFLDKTPQEFPVLLSVLVLIRWLNLTWSCRAFMWAGQKILPIVKASVSPQIGGIAAVTLFSLLGFLHCFLALELRSDAPDYWTVILGGVRLLLLGDGDGIDVALSVGGREEVGDQATLGFLALAVVTFCICVLNLFIAVHAEAYDKAQDEAYKSFMQERASICLQCILKPSWPPRWLENHRVPHRLAVYCTIVVVSLVVWFLLLQVQDIPPAVPTVLLFLAMMVGDSILVQRPWDKSNADTYYLWMCYRENHDEQKLLPVGKTKASDGAAMKGRINAANMEAQALYRKIDSEMQQARKYMVAKNANLSMQLQDVELRMTSLQGSIEKLIDVARAGRSCKEKELLE
mmetsp:Transcript_24356/g.44085  ORF Transcript_24356/g.44085 Transcript_24356/m.44085 type:complete len:1162 (+) Transcript_24356:65-3550(+)